MRAADARERREGGKRPKRTADARKKEYCKSIAFGRYGVQEDICTDFLKRAADARGRGTKSQLCGDHEHLPKDYPTIVKSLFDTDGNCHFKLRDVQQLLKEAQDEIEVLGRDNNNSTSKRKCYTLITCIDNFLKETEVLKMVRDRLKTATRGLVEQKECTNQLEILLELAIESLELKSQFPCGCGLVLWSTNWAVLRAYLGRLRGVELQFAPANGQIANLDDLVKALQTSLLLEQEKAKQCTTLKESEAEKLVAQVESTTIANQERFLSKFASILRVILNGALQLLEQEIQQQAAELARKEKEYVVYQNTISQSKMEVDRKEEIIASFSHEIDKAAKAVLKVESELASVQSKPADAEKLSAVTAAKLDSADLTISDLREQHTGLKAQNASLASELTSETNSALRSIAVAKDEIKEKLVERNSAH
ncbi:uncharacterized protein EI90DRAFT_3293965 [Cantharellus anzutake]|uniref:uncharacterized protein n=1 Tax=Cantharellus anzutake TaxID=1750568 RepID=UPI00190718B7|nr:uncharacterized protein EI90DRAFT_3293965 [Cantharellus anzutake]KAF8315276.1 hypothetical protein EI90DRAFT_3293965 [Cantharellus anzutake]